MSTGKHCIHADRSLRFADAKAILGSIQKYFFRKEGDVSDILSKSGINTLLTSNNIDKFVVNYSRYVD